MSVSFYAQAIKEAGVEFDVIFGPAYKGIPLATAVSVAWLQMYGESKDVSYNRKEAKDHGEVIEHIALYNKAN
jgi:orotate phosphoribosyltransferase